MKVFFKLLVWAKKGDSLSNIYLDYEHLCDYLDNLPLNAVVTLGLLIDDTVLNNVDYEIQK